MHVVDALSIGPCMLEVILGTEAVSIACALQVVEKRCDAENFVPREQDAECVCRRGFEQLEGGWFCTGTSSIAYSMCLHRSLQQRFDSYLHEALT